MVPLVSIWVGVVGIAGRTGMVGTLGAIVVVGSLGRVAGTVGATIGTLKSLVVVGRIGRVVPVKKLDVLALIVLRMTGRGVGSGVGCSGPRLKALFGFMTSGLTGLSLFLPILARLGLRLMLKEVWGWDICIRIGATVGVVGLGRVSGRLEALVGGLGRGVVLGLLVLTLLAIPRF